MATISVNLTAHARDYVQGLRYVRERTLEFCKQLKSLPSRVSADSIEACRLDAVGELEAIDEALIALGFTHDFYTLRDYVTFERICDWIAFYESDAHTLGERQIFRAVLSVFGFTYTADESAIAVRYTYTPEGR